jgi:hypothetical protein
LRLSASACQSTPAHISESKKLVEVWNPKFLELGNCIRHRGGDLVLPISAEPRVVPIAL